MANLSVVSTYSAEIFQAVMESIKLYLFFFVNANEQGAMGLSRLL
jgi:hypothetical protein